MIHVDHREPNFVVELEGFDGVVLEEIYAAGSEAELRADIQRRIDRGVLKDLKSVKPFDFAKWSKRARDATEKAIREYDAGKGAAYEFNASIWGDLKAFLLTLFHKKCAYCEADFKDVAWGDVEHYRPKGKVTDSLNQVVLDKAGRPHTGYYWLAYELGNLMPSCQLCNQAHGKLNQFPIADETNRAFLRTDSLDFEGPLLLNPYRDNPRHDLRFVEKTGMVAGVTPAGEASVVVYRLNREELMEGRRQHQNAVWHRMAIALASDDTATFTETYTECLKGLMRFSSATLAAIQAHCERFGLKLGRNGG